ncbi:hypothetical protein R3P38DRAFT_2775496 [Favolaschia claudopus]|uniref:Uncharacterized protein n=1 Tax=Favolaschia claudopus TaxID=2862362 RepID=A0AAW0BV03_9AGAR
MCRYLIEKDYCKLCRAWRPGERWRKLADCNLATCKYSDSHLLRVLMHGSDTSPRTDPHVDQATESRNLAVSVIVRTVLVDGRPVMQEAAIAAAAVQPSHNNSSQEGRGYESRIIRVRYHPYARRRSILSAGGCGTR